MPGLRWVLACVIACAVALALSSCATSKPAKGNVYYAVSAKLAQVYRFGPSQPTGADALLKQGQRIVMLRQEYGFSRVMTDDGMVLAGLITWPDASELLILDPSDLSAEPLARVHIPVAIAAGLHSAWLPGE